MADLSTVVGHGVTSGAEFGYLVAFLDSIWDFLDLDGVFGSVVVIGVRKFYFVFDNSVFGDSLAYLSVTALDSLAGTSGTHLLFTYEMTNGFTAVVS